MKLRNIVGMAVITFALGGCSSPGLVGTWNGRGAAANAPFTFGSVSFVGDKTFTAESRYQGGVKVQSGTWSTEGNKLFLTAEKAKREYTYKVNKGELVVTEPKSGHTITLDRINK